MFHRIIVGVDGSPGAGAALRLAEVLGGPEALVTVTHVETWTPLGDARHADRAEAGRPLEIAREQVGDRPGVAYRETAGPSVAAELHRMARETTADLVVVGSSRHRGTGRVLLGSNTEATLHGAPCAVAVAAGAAPRPVRRIGVGFDGTPAARETVRAAHALAREHDAELTVLGVVDTRHPYATFGPESGYGDIRERARELLRSVVVTLDDDRVHLQLHEGDPGHEILALGRESDLLIVGARPNGAVLRLLLGSVSSRVVRRAGCPVLVLPVGAAVRSGPPAPIR